MKKQFDCLRCGWHWGSFQKKPSICPHCKSALWDTPSNKIFISLNLNKEIRLKLEQMAADENKTPQELAIELLSVYLDKENIVVGRGDDV